MSLVESINFVLCRRFALLLWTFNSTSHNVSYDKNALVICLRYPWNSSFRPRLYSFCICWSELIDPPANGFVGNINAAFDHEFLHISEAEIEPEIHPDGAFDDIWMEAVMGINWGFHHDALADCRKICINVTKSKNVCRWSSLALY